VAHGPHPRDFSTDLPRKMYDRAWRTALSYRYKQGELLLLEDEIDLGEIGQAPVEQFNEILNALQLGRANGGSMFVISDDDLELVAAFSELGPGAKMKTEDDVDVKDLLTKGKLLIQRSVLDRILAAHSSDLNRTVPKALYHD
jgi:large subunit ribosomal protein L4